MFWFGKKQKKIQAASDKKIEKEVAMHKRSAKKKVDEVKKATNKLNNVFEENGFTVKIFLAAGGKDPKQKIGTHYGH